MSPDQALSLNSGDVVRHTSTGSAYTVISNDGRKVHAVRPISVSNQSEWELHGCDIGSLPVGATVRHRSGPSYLLIAPGVGADVKDVALYPECWELFSRSAPVATG